MSKAVLEKFPSTGCKAPVKNSCLNMLVRMFEWILGHAHALLPLLELLKCLHLGTWLSMCSHICLNQNNVSQIQICSTAPVGLLPASPRFPARTVAIPSLLLLLNSSPTQHCLAISQHILLRGSSCLEPRGSCEKSVSFQLHFLSEF